MLTPRDPDAPTRSAPIDLRGLPLRRAAVFAVLGLLAGYLYHHFVGCLLGGCSADGPLTSMVHGGLVGVLVAVAIP